ncbi:MAG TPA: AI-2E family transporter [Methanocella sp.]|nr:AI-2E family transporter [Methanocella sp.]
MQNILMKAYDAKWTLAGLALAIFILWVSLPFVTPVIFALFMYYITRPVKRKLQRYFKNEALLALVCMLVLTVPLAALIIYLILFATGQLFMFFEQYKLEVIPPGHISDMAQIVSSMGHSFDPDEFKYENFSAVLGQWYGSMKVYSDSIFGIKDFFLAAGMTMADAAFKALLALILTFLLLLDDDRLVKWFNATFPELAREHNGLFVRYAKAVDEDFEQIFFGNMLNILFFTIIAAAIYSLLNVFAPDPAFLIPFPLLLGILSGLFALMPVLGGWMVDIPILLYALAQSLISGAFSKYWWYLVVMAIALFVFVENMPNYLLRPFVSHGKVDVGLLMLAYIVGPIIFGFPGLFIGAMLLVLATHYFGIVVPDLRQRGEAGTGKVGEGIKDDAMNSEK